MAGELHQPSNSRRARLRTAPRVHSHESGPRAPGGEGGDVSVFVGERQGRKKNVRKRNNERRKPCDLRQPFLEALPNHSYAEWNNVQKRLSVEERPFMAALRQCKRMSPFRARGPAGLKPGDLLNPLRGSKEPLFHICAGAEGVIRNEHCANLKIREFLRFAE